MNYEEMLNAREGAAMHKEQLPIGTYYKKQIGKKYRHIVELRPVLADSLIFCDGLRRDQQATLAFKDARQLHYELHEDSGGIYELELEQGNYQPLSQLLRTNPAVVAERGFIDRLVGELMDVAEKLHEAGIFHVCFDQRNIFVRKGTYAPVLLCHGSSFSHMRQPAQLYQGFEDSLAPEVLQGGPVDARTDIYSLGRLIGQLFDSGDMTFEYKRLVAKATAADPAQRYQSVAQMRSTLTKSRSTKRTLLTMIGALAVVGLLIFLYFDMVPEATNVEFVDHTGIGQNADPFSAELEDTSTYDPTEYLDPELVAYLDSLPASDLTDDEWDSVVHITNVNNIFTERFTRQAERMLSTLYNNEQMGASQSNFVAKSQSVITELLEYAREQGKECGLTEEQAAEAADHILARLQAEKAERLSQYGAANGGGDDE